MAVDGDSLLPFILLAPVLTLQAVLFTWYGIHCQLPEESYFKPFIAPYAFTTLPILLIAALNAVVLGPNLGKLRWRAIDPTGGVRLFVVAVTATLAWYCATYDFNFYYDQAHYFDRGLIVLLAVLAWLHPAAVPPFIILAFTMASQTAYPLPESAWYWPDKRILFDELVLFNATLLVGAFSRAALSLFPFLALCLTGSLYFHAAIAKLSIGPSLLSWPTSDSISDLMVAGYLQGGWLHFVNAQTLFLVWRWLAHFDAPMAIVTLAIELSGLVILVGRRASRIVLCAFIALQTGIALASGIFFWKWCVQNAALAISLRHIDPAAVFRVRRRYVALASALVIVGAPLYFRPIHFGWFDTNFFNFFTFQVEGASGAIYDLDPRFFAPYDIRFVQSRFFYLLHDKVLVGTYGTTQDFRIMKALEGASAADIESLKRDMGTNYYDRAKSADFASFIVRFLGNAQKRGGKFISVNYLGPPYHFRGAVPGETVSLSGAGQAPSRVLRRTPCGPKRNCQVE